jgi:gas vesicle protein
MVITIVTSFLFGFFVGGLVGALSIVLGVIAKRNVEDIPETPIGVTR